MALTPRQAVNVTNVATRLDQAPTDNIAGDRLLVVAQAAGTLVLGGSSAVTAANGCRVPVIVGTQINVDLDDGEQLWGIVASGSLAVDVLLAGA